MFVVVHLIEPKVNIVVPEEFVFLDPAKLRNLGVNRNQTHLIYWSKMAEEYQGRVDDENKPNFHLPISNESPPPMGAEHACYFGRTVRFFSKCILVTQFSFADKRVFANINHIK